MIRWIIMFKRILIEIVNFIQSQFFIKIIYYYDDQHYLLQTNEEYTKYNINRSCILYIIVSIYEKKLSISGFFNINIVSLFKSLFITVRTLEDMTYTLWLVLLETRCVVFYCLFTISPSQLVISRLTPDVTKHSFAHRENWILFNCHLQKSTLYPLHDCGCSSQTSI